MESCAVPVVLTLRVIYQHSPDAITVSQHLSNTTGQSEVNGYLYFSYYRTHCSIFESSKSPHGTDTVLHRNGLFLFILLTC